MENIRFLLITGFFVTLFLLYQAWQADYGKQTPGPAAPQTTGSTAVPGSDASDKPEIPGTATQDRRPAVARQDAVATPAQSANTVTVKTDNYRLHIDPHGAGIVKVELLKYPVSVDTPDQPFVLMDRSEELLYITQGGLLSKEEAPTHKSEFKTDQDEYQLGNNQKTLDVPFYWSSGNITVKKIFEFQRDNYQVHVHYEITNNGQSPWAGQSYIQLKRDKPKKKKGFGSGRYTFTGAVISSPEKRYKKISFKDIDEEELNEDIVNGWAAMIQHYFVTALVPAEKTASYHYYTMAQTDGNYAIGMVTPSVSVGPGETRAIDESMYLGPAVQKDLEQVADGLELTVDYGKLWFIAKPLFWCLSKLHGLTHNWGWSIILVTVFLKLVFYPLSAAGYRSMAKMKKVQPRLTAIRERYQDDKTRQNQAMMQLYKEEKINPLGGCLPIVIQIPVFLAFYYMLLESVEMRQAGFIFWLHDLSSPDPYYILPVLMGITMFIGQKLNPAPPDPIQAKVMSFLPLIFTVVFAALQSGLVLYYFVNNVLSICQQWLITRQLEQSGLKPKST